jgi:NHLM bacteriocin system ABC transporter ATP-binding protein
VGWFDEQIRQRQQNDNEAFENSFIQMAGIVMGRGITASMLDERQKTKDAVDEILKFYHVKIQELPENIKDINEQLEYLMRPSGIMRRSVQLTGSWYREAAGAFLARRKSGGVTALLPAGLTGYTFFDEKTGKRVKVNRKNADEFEREAISFYKPLPLKKLRFRDLLIYIVQTLSAADYILIAAATLAVILVGMLSPKIVNIIFAYVAGSDHIQLYTATVILLVCVTITGSLLSGVKNMLLMRIQTKTSAAVEAASMMRVLSLPVAFFKKYSSGELSNRAQSINNLCMILTDTILSAGLTSVFSLVYITQIFRYAPGLVLPAFTVILITVVVSLFSAVVEMNQMTLRLGAEAKESGINYALISGIQKIRLSGAEKRAFTRWAGAYEKSASLTYDPPTLIKINSVITTAIALAGNIAMYYFAVKTKVSVADFYSFSVAYGMVSGAFLSLTGVALTVAEIKPEYEMVRPILQEVPEVALGKKVITKLSGGIELNNVSFRYSEQMPLILDNLSLKIRPGQYVAIVGKTGCGKSTLLRILLGFETPARGAVYYDGQDLAKIDLKSLRRRIGVVMQEGKLFSGDIYSNIVVSAPWLTLEEAWDAAELAGIAEDIRNMPMGMNTIISEGQGGVSGGQRQRLMIARAIAPKPGILMFDEATSALDNITQKKISESLDSMKCTRIVIAHRLSTIRQCDRIIVLDAGKIIEDGNYRELIEKKGFFAELVARQRLDDTEYVGQTTMF